MSRKNKRCNHQLVMVEMEIEPFSLPLKRWRALGKMEQAHQLEKLLGPAGEWPVRILPVKSRSKPKKIVVI